MCKLWESINTSAAEYKRHSNFYEYTFIVFVCVCLYSICFHQEMCIVSRHRRLKCEVFELIHYQLPLGEIFSNWRTKHRPFHTQWKLTVCAFWVFIFAFWNVKEICNILRKRNYWNESDFSSSLCKVKQLQMELAERKRVKDLEYRLSAFTGESAYDK